MKQILLFFFFSVSVFSQTKKDTLIIPKKDTLFIAKDTIKQPIDSAFFTDKDLKVIDSLLVDEKFSSALFPTHSGSVLSTDSSQSF